MTPKAGKAKGRRLQDRVSSDLREITGLGVDDIRPAPMGQKGPDVWMSTRAQTSLPFVFECSNVERLPIWSKLEQAQGHAHLVAPLLPRVPVLVFARNRSEPYACVPWADFLALLRKARPVP